MNELQELTPSRLFEEFRKDRLDIGKRAVTNFMELSDEKKQSFLESTIEFLAKENKDTVRAWGVDILQAIGSDDAFHALVSLLENADNDQKQEFRYTRFFALRAIERMAITDSRRDRLKTIIKTVAADRAEQGFIWASSLILLSNMEQEAENKLKAITEDRRDYWTNFAVMRALREFPQTKLTDGVLFVIRNTEYPDLKLQAIRVLRAGEYRDDVKVIRALGEIVITDPARHIRLEAVMSLGNLRRREAEADLLMALRDEDAEIRVRAAEALLTFLSKEEILTTIVQQVLQKGIDGTDLRRLIEAIPRIDPDRSLAGELLGREMAGVDRSRAEAAERILIEVGGWTAVQKLGHRRSTLKSLDKLLEDSEQIVKSTFDDTIRQARRNFYFAMIINAFVVAVGLALIVIAIRQLVNEPEFIGSWLVPGGAGVIGIIINLGFNNPRQNAREDLAALLNVNVLFLGYLRQLNEIEATFKHGFVENENFGIEDMRKTVAEIDKSVVTTLKMGALHLYLSKNLPKDAVST